MKEGVKNFVSDSNKASKSLQSEAKDSTARVSLLYRRRRLPQMAAC
jgi:hypothetical protein